VFDDMPNHGRGVRYGHRNFDDGNSPGTDRFYSPLSFLNRGGSYHWNDADFSDPLCHFFNSHVSSYIFASYIPDTGFSAGNPGRL
jgi:hypothetical protein